MKTINKKRYKGLWFYGMSGTGKTFASKFLYKKIKQSFILDGDYIRKVISKDLSYSVKDRTVQINRMNSLALLAIINKTFPIVSTVYMNEEILVNSKKNKILVVKVVRKDLDVVKKKHKTYKNIKNVIGKDIFLPKIKTKEIKNTGDKEFNNELKKFLQLFKL